MKSSLTRTRWAAIGAAIAVTFGGGAVFVANADSGAQNGFFPLAESCRLLDTRATDLGNSIRGKGIRQGSVKDKNESSTTKNNDIVVIFDDGAYAAETDGASASGANYTFKVSVSSFRPIMGDCNYLFGVSGALDGETPEALLLNVTTVGMTASGFVTVYPYLELNEDELNRPFYSSLNPISSLPSVSNNVTVRLNSTPSVDTPTIPSVKCGSGDYGASQCNSLDAFRIYNHNGTTHVIVDVLGVYYSLPAES